MPSNLIKSYAEQTGKSVAEVEKIWDNVQRMVLSKFKKKTPSFFAYVNSIVRKMLKLKKKKTRLKEYLEMSDIIFVEDSVNLQLKD